MTVPSGFGIDSFVPPSAGWTQQLQQTGSGDSAVITKVTWTGGKTPTGEDSLFQFLAQPRVSEDVHLRGRSRPTRTGRSSTGPARSPRTRPHRRSRPQASVGGGGSSTLTIIALVVGVLGLLAGGLALLGGSRGRSLA